MNIKCATNLSFKFVRIGKTSQIVIMVYGNTNIEKVGLCEWHMAKWEITEAEVGDGMTEVKKGQPFSHGTLLDTETQGMCLCR